MVMTRLFVAPPAVNEVRALHWRSVVVAQVDHRIGECLECVVDRLRCCTALCFWLNIGILIR
ncbi:hypothetical protein SAMN05446935_7764 [Burkholderia sp. YR290]|nr:hypothetical protein SAMN05446935_7764 [Burkholderia sp. YR290]